MENRDGRQRCFGSGPGKGFYAAYHDQEWGVPVHDDRKLFEFLLLEGAQAGLSWETVLRKRENYRRAFCEFDPTRVARLSDAELERRRGDSGIIRNRLKILSARTNARAFLRIQEEHGSFDAYLWSFVGGKQVVNEWNRRADVPTATPVSDALSRDLRKRGMNFVGSTIIYAYMQAVGLVDDHVSFCWRRNLSD